MSNSKEKVKYTLEEYLALPNRDDVYDQIAEGYKPENMNEFLGPFKMGNDPKSNSKTMIMIGTFKDKPEKDFDVVFTVKMIDII